MQGIFLEDSLSSIHYFKTASGHEIKASQNFDDEKPTFFAFGNYDLVSFSDIDEPSSKFNSSNIIDLYEEKLIRWKGDDYSSPKPSSLLNHAIAAEVVSLELFPFLGLSPHSNQTLQQIFSRIKNIIGSHDDANYGLYGSMGKADYYLIITSECVEKLDQINSELRNIKALEIAPDLKYSELFANGNDHNFDDVDFPVFNRIDIVPLVSVNNVIKNENYGLLSGKCQALIEVTGNTLVQSYIEHNLQQGFLTFRSSSGNTWFLQSDNFIEFSELLRKLLEFRRGISSKKDGGEFNTKSTILFQLDNKIDVNFLYDVSNNWEDYAEPSSQMVTLGRERLYNIITQYINEYSALYLNGIYHNSVEDMEYFPQLLLGDCNKIIRYLDKANAADTNELEKSEFHKFVDELEVQVKGAVSIAKEAINQRLQHRYTTYIKAATQLIRFISDTTKASIDLSNREAHALDWMGFVLVSELDGYSLKPFQIYTIPTSSLNEPLTASVNWHSFSHEASHWFYNQLELDLDVDMKRTLEEGLRRLGFGGSGQSIKQELNHYNNILVEYFATWFDYYHFYHEDQALFQKHIWKSWSSLAFTVDKMSDYISRSFMIYLARNLDSHIKNYFNNNELNFYTQEFMNYKEYIQSELGLSEIAGIDAITIDRAFELTYAFAPAFLNLVDKYKFDVLRSRLFENSDSVDAAYASNLEGMIYSEPISNPFLLLHRLIRTEVMDAETIIDQKTQLAYLLSTGM